MKRSVCILLTAVLVCLLFSACGGDVPDVTESTGTETTLLQSEKPEFVPGAKLTLELDPYEVSFPSTAPVIRASRIVWEGSELKDVFIPGGLSGVTVKDDLVREGAADALRAYTETHSIAMFNFLDSNVIEANRRSVGHCEYRVSSLMGYDMVLSEFAGLLAVPNSRELTLRTGYFEDGIPEDEFFEGVLDSHYEIFRKLGAEGDAMPVPEDLCLFTPEEQVEYVDVSGLSLRKLVDQETGQLSPLSSVKDELGKLAVIGWRQEFYGIPVNRATWGARFSSGTMGFAAVTCQSIVSGVSQGGSAEFVIDNLFEPIGTECEKPVASPVKAVEHLNTALGYVVDDVHYYLVDVELCYAAFEDGDEFVLYPIWLLFVECERSYSGNVSRVAEMSDIYAYDGYSGELLKSIELPEY